MEAVLNWIKGIMGCLLLMSLVLQCVPGKVYRPYLRLFMGIILILTVLSPLTDLTGFGETLETMVGELAYQEAVPGWKEDLLKGEEWAEEQIIARAEEMSREAEEADDSFIRQMEKKNQLELLISAVSKLPARKRDICLLKLMKGFTNKEIAEQLNIKVPTVKVHYNQAIRMLRKYLLMLVIAICAFGELWK